MDHRLNRLTKKDAIRWDAAFKRFCETGIWELENETDARKQEGKKTSEAATSTRICQ